MKEYDYGKIWLVDASSRTLVHDIYIYLDVYGLDESDYVFKQRVKERGFPADPDERKPYQTTIHISNLTYSTSLRDEKEKKLGHVKCIWLNISNAYEMSNNGLDGLYLNNNWSLNDDGEEPNDEIEIHPNNGDFFTIKWFSKEIRSNELRTETIDIEISRLSINKRRVVYYETNMG
jgi:hypothetical protein